MVIVFFSILAIRGYSIQMDKHLVMHSSVLQKVKNCQPRVQETSNLDKEGQWTNMILASSILSFSFCCTYLCVLPGAEVN